MSNRVSRHALRLLGLTLLLALIAAAVRWTLHETPPAICQALARGRIGTVYVTSPTELSCAGVHTLEVLGTPVEQALHGNDSLALGQALLAVKGAAVAVRPGDGGPGITGKLARLEHVDGLRGLVLSSQLAVYQAHREPNLAPREAEALSYVARALLRGAREPNLASFPAALRRVERVEVIVTLSDHGEPRLWRSARGTSLARTLLTAARVARDRWHEREQAMGGPLPKRILQLDVEVGLLSEDGTIVDTQRAFVDRALTPQHGIGFDYRSGWHYLSPVDVQSRGKGSAFAALTALLADQGLGVGALNDPDMRVYRFVPKLLSVSKAPLGSEASSAD